ncbi:MAG: imidazolonepropionase [Candidatus Thermoplasmatota archaeon]|nr:imidazolonepropionase [Candidatus Thermoplasmatota archaeon]
MPEADLLLTDAHQAATPVGGPVLAGDRQGQVETIPEATLAIKEGRIQAVGSREEMADWTATKTVDCTGATMVPGFVDAHTHLVWAGDRADELVLKLEGHSYQEILAQGGGIHSTVKATRNAPVGLLKRGCVQRLDRCLAAGTTTLEAKTGYALTHAGEIELLEVLASLEEHPIDVVATLLAAHAVPRGSDRVGFVEMIRERLTPEVAEKDLARFNDVFVDQGAFTVEEGRQILQSGLDHGLPARIHADELACTRAARLGLQVNARSIDHLNKVHPDDIDALARARLDGAWSGVATLCPVTPFTSDLPYAPARDLIEAGVPVALGSDMNPNAWTEGMLFTIYLAVHAMRMTPAEALVAATVNSAWSLGLEDRGRLAPGQRADIAVLDMPRYEYLGYRFTGDPVRQVIKGGRVVHGGTHPPAPR